jgi:glucose/mannose-6-phosphate isomerase
MDLTLDRSDMLGKIRGLAAQLGTGYGLGQEAWKRLDGRRPRALAVAGMGASALGGDLLRLYLAGQAEIPVFVVRDYGLPRFIGDGDLVVISSYSGNTEEALSVFDQALARKAALVCVSSGGRLLEEARRRSVPHAAIPGGLPPRAGLGYSFSALLALARQVGLCPDPRDELARCAERLEGLGNAYRAQEPDGNPALKLAGDLAGRVPIIYCGTDLEAVGVRWKNQFCENSKQVAFVSLLPEANHNEVMGWETSARGIDAGVVVLRAPDEHPSVARSLAVLEGLAGAAGSFCGEFWADGSSLLNRMFSLILLGDYASVYLALGRGMDPTPIGTIDRIKAWLKQGRGESE